MDLGSRIRQLRQARGWPLRFLATKTSVTYGFLCDVENSTRTPSEDTLRTIAVALDVPFELLAPLSGRPTRAMQAYLLTHPAMWSLWSAFAEHDVTNEKIEAIMATTGNLKEGQ